MRRMDEGEKEAVDGNEAEACYVVSVSTLGGSLEEFRCDVVEGENNTGADYDFPLLFLSHLPQP
jgi:hypothetical protein